jgi:tRNA threonylcarbamoyladenosine biosynthesis protein TsaB
VGLVGVCLAIDTSGRSTGVAVVAGDGGAVLAERATAVRRPGGGQPLLPLIDEALAAAGTGLAGVALLACAIGPGGFTGLRVGVATLKGIGLARGVPAVGVPTLRALAATAAGRQGASPETWVAALMDARKGEVYVGVHRADGEGAPLLADGALRPPDAAARLIGLAGEGHALLLCGDGLPLVAPLCDGVAALRAARADPTALSQVSPAVVARLALAMAARGEAVAVDALLPAYHRLSEAEVALHARARA